MRRLTRILIVGLITVIAGAACAAPAAPNPSPIPPTPAASASVVPASPTAPTVAAARRADLDQLLERLVALHPNPFLDEGEAVFRARLEALADRAGELTEAGFLVGVMDLMGHRDRDGHSGAWAMAQTGERLHAWPIWMLEFPDGLRIVAAREPYEDLVGARVLAVGGTPVDDAWTAVAPLVPSDNPTNLRANLPMYLTLPEVLGELDLLRPGAAALTVEDADGSPRDVELDALPIEAFRDWVFGRYEGFPIGLPPDPDGLAVQRHRSAIFWSEPLDGGGTYIGFNQVQTTRGPDGITMATATDDVHRAINAGATEPVIVDMRNNPGGNNTTFWPFRSALERHATERPGSVAVIAGRGTFSAAGNFVTELEAGDAGASIHLVGEPPGGGPNIYGDVRVVTLEHSGIVVLISTRYHERRAGDDRLEVDPDIAVELTWEDVVAGRDPVLDAAVGATRAAIDD
jgi:hypothetical protein